MFPVFFTLVLGVALNLVSNIFTPSTFKKDDKINTYSLEITSDPAINLGGKKIDALFEKELKGYLKDLKMKEKKSDPDTEFIVKIDSFDTESVLGSDDKKMNVTLKGSLEIKNNVYPDENKKDSISKTIEIDAKNKDKKEDNAKKVIEQLCEDIIKTYVAKEN